MVTKEIIWQVDEPVPYPGNTAEKTANFATHDFARDDDDVRCSRCDSKVWHQAANYPCGQEPPRQITTYYKDGTETSVPA
jgi:3',5'-cyclic AMP phosphodiesterase CpdA